MSKKNKKGRGMTGYSIVAPAVAGFALLGSSLSWIFALYWPKI